MTPRRSLAVLAFFPALLLAAGALPVPSVARAATERKPNIVLMLADDLGYAGIGCYGCLDIPTPRLDSLAREGVRCTNGYVTCPVCSPTRAALLTGRYQQRFGHEFNPGPAPRAPENVGLPLTETTLAQRLKSAGYATGLVGKWHLGYAEPFHPQRRGFDEFFGFLGGAHPYVAAGAAQRNVLLRGTEEVDEKEYLTDAFRREAVAFIDRHRAEPFFLYLALNAVHGPMHASPRHLDRFAGISDEKRRTHASMVAAMDEAVGAVLERLRQAGLDEETLVFFLSDNGGPTRVTTSRNDPLRGFKGQVYEGGIRVPFIVRWTGRLPAGKVYEPPVISLDVVPSVLAAAEVTPPREPRLDGADLLPFLAGKSGGAPQRPLFWRFGNQSAVRRGNLKLVRIAEEAVQLYDLSGDVGEQKNLAAEKPEAVAELEVLRKGWDAELAKPLWGRSR